MQFVEEGLFHERGISENDLACAGVGVRPSSSTLWPQRDCGTHDCEQHCVFSITRRLSKAAWGGAVDLRGQIAARAQCSKLNDQPL